MCFGEFESFALNMRVLSPLSPPLRNFSASKYNFIGDLRSDLVAARIYVCVVKVGSSLLKLMRDVMRWHAMRGGLHSTSAIVGVEYPSSLGL